MATEKEVFDFINKIVLEEKGTRVKLSSTVRDTDLDSFGYTVLMLELDDQYGYFKDVPPEVDPFSTIDWENLTIKEMINKCL